MEVRFTWDKVKHLKCRISWHFIRLWYAMTTSFWSQGAFILPKGTPVPICPRLCLLSLWIYIFWVFHRNRITQCVALCTALLSLVAQMVKNLPTMQETPVQSLGLEDPLEMRMPTPSSIPGASLVVHMVKNLPANAGDVRDVGSVPGWGGSPGGGNGNLLQYSCQENPMDRRAWWATVLGIAKSGTWQYLSIR